MTSINKDTFKPFSLSTTVSFVLVWQDLFLKSNHTHHFPFRFFLGKDDTENVEYDDMENDPSSDGVEKVYLDMLNLALSEFSESEKVPQHDYRIKHGISH